MRYANLLKTARSYSNYKEYTGRDFVPTPGARDRYVDLGAADPDNSTSDEFMSFAYPNMYANGWKDDSAYKRFSAIPGTYAYGGKPRSYNGDYGPVGFRRYTYDMFNAAKAMYKDPYKFMQDRNSAYDARWKSLYSNARTQADVDLLDSMSRKGMVPPIYVPRFHGTEDVKLKFRDMHDGSLFVADRPGVSFYSPNDGNSILFSDDTDRDTFNEEAVEHPLTVSAQGRGAKNYISPSMKSRPYANLVDEFTRAMFGTKADMANSGRRSFGDIRSLDDFIRSLPADGGKDTKDLRTLFSDPRFKPSVEDREALWQLMLQSSNEKQGDGTAVV